MQLEEFEQFISNFTKWASNQSDIQAAALVGSYARNTATDTSDVDLVILVDDPGGYINDQTWLKQFGEIRQFQVEDYGPLTSIRVWYSDGREIEYGITRINWAASPLDDGTRRVITDGMRILFERTPILSQHVAKK